MTVAAAAAGDASADQPSSCILWKPGRAAVECRRRSGSIFESSFRTLQYSVAVVIDGGDTNKQLNRRCHAKSTQSYYCIHLLRIELVRPFN